MYSICLVFNTADSILKKPQSLLIFGSLCFCRPGQCASAGGTHSFFKIHRGSFLLTLPNGFWARTGHGIQHHLHFLKWSSSCHGSCRTGRLWVGIADACKIVKLGGRGGFGCLGMNDFLPGPFGLYRSGLRSTFHRLQYSFCLHSLHLYNFLPGSSGLHRSSLRNIFRGFYCDFRFFGPRDRSDGYIFLS